MADTTAAYGPMGVDRLPYGDLDDHFTDMGVISNLELRQYNASGSSIISHNGALVSALQDAYSTTISFTSSQSANKLSSAWSWPNSPMFGTSTWVFDTPNTRIIAPYGHVTEIRQASSECTVTIKAYPDIAGTCIQRTLTWEETWHAHVAAALEGHTQRAAELLAELAEGYPSQKKRILEAKKRRTYPTSKTPWGRK